MDLGELYQEIIIDHSKNPRNHVVLENYTHEAEGYNPLCGDKVHLYINMDNGIVEKISFQGCGCAISQASASILTQMASGKKLETIVDIGERFRDVLTNNSSNTDDFESLDALLGVKNYPMRIKCATLAWHTFTEAIGSCNKLHTGDKNE